MRHFILQFCGFVLAVLLAACGGSGDDDHGTAPQGGTVVGTAGGTVNGPGGVQLVIPPGALAADTTIKIEQSAHGAPALPSDLAPLGPMFAFTPHGLQFATPVTLTQPFDAAAVPAGTFPALYKTNTQNQWDRLDNVTFGLDTVSAQITGFSNGQAGVELRECPRRYWTLNSTANGETDLYGGGPRLGVTNRAIEPVLSGQQGCGEVTVPFLFGLADRTFEQDNGATPGLAMGEVYSSPDGKSFSAYAEAPSGDQHLPNFRSGGKARLQQFQSYVKRASDATLQLELSAGFLAALDYNGSALDIDCLNHPVASLSDFEIQLFCTPLMTEVEFLITAYRHGKDLGRTDFDELVFFATRGGASMKGFFGVWTFAAYSHSDSLTPLWTDANFTVTGLNGSSPLADLNTPLFITIDLSSIEVCPPEVPAIFCADKAFTISSLVSAEAQNRRGRESGAAAYLRDPQKIGGNALRMTGLEATNNPAPLPTGGPAPVPCSGGPDPAAGVLQWSAGHFLAMEGTPRVRDLFVTRTQGNKGAVSVDFSAGGGTGVAGVDYEAPNVTVRFADGDTAPRLVSVELPPSVLADAGKTVNLTLSAPGGCASLGPTSTAVLTIVEHGTPAPVNLAFSVGGTVSGLTGSGLVLEDRAQFVTVAPSGNGSFQFNRAYRANAAYSVLVTTHPSNPIQHCSVVNGSGTVTANVSDIQIHCAAPPPPPSGLDPSFGSGGKASAGLAGGADAIALQADGKIVAVGGVTLARYHADGSLDTGFGAAGNVGNVFNGSASTDAARGVAVQADGKIVVVGYARRAVGVLPATQDFAAARFNADGSRDASFGNGGVAHVGFADSTDQAWQVLIQADGKIVLAGHAATRDALSGRAKNDFAVARLNADGSRDLAFAGDGRANFGTDSDLGYAAALQPDGKIVVAGRAGPVFINNNTPNSVPDVGLARFNADGSLDTTFGAGGTVRQKLSQSWSEASDIVVQGDGKILVTVQAVEGSFFRYTLARFHADGRPDAGFGAGGTVNTAIGVGHGYARALALQADGKIIVAGQVWTSNVNSDFAIVRYHADGTLDTAFGNGGVWVVDFFAGTDGVSDLVVQPDGRIVAAGLARNGSSNGIGLVRILP